MCELNGEPSNPEVFPPDDEQAELSSKAKHQDGKRTTKLVYGTSSTFNPPN